jgi:hypothetical protein
MYLRTTKRHNKDGSIVEYYQLAETRWDPSQRRPTAHILYNFGRADAVKREALLRLAWSISRVCQGGQALLSPEDRAGLLERLARDALSADDRHVLGQLIQVTPGSQAFLAPLGQSAPPDAPEQTKRRRTVGKSSRRRQGRAEGERQRGPRGVAVRNPRG